MKKEKERKLPIFTPHPEQDDVKLKKKGVSLVGFLDTVRPRKDGTFTVRIRITYNRYPKYYTTTISLTRNEFEQIENARPRNKLRDKKLVIYELIKKAHDIIIDMNSFSFEKFEKKFLNKPGAWNNVFFAFTEYITDLKKKDKIGTATTYTSALKSFKTYHKKNKLLFDEITVDWLNKYESWMQSNSKSPTTISIYARCLRRLYNMAIKRSDANKDLYPFGSADDELYAPPEHQNIKKALPISDIKKIFEYVPEKGSSEHWNRDLWLFSYLANGMNMADIFRLKFSDMQGENIVFIRKKTNHKRKLKPIIVPLTNQIKKIIEVWGNKEVKHDSYIFKILTKGMTAEKEYSKIGQATKLCNDYMKRIAVKIRIDEKISTYYARHSYASVLKLSGANISYISESLGHSNLAVTENYLSSFDNETRKENANKLTDWD